MYAVLIVLYLREDLGETSRVCTRVAIIAEGGRDAKRELEDDVSRRECKNRISTSRRKANGGPSRPTRSGGERLR